MSVRHPSQKSYDFAYGCFLFCGVVVFLTAVIGLIPMSTGTAGGIGFLILIPLSVVTIIVLFVGLWRTIVLQKQIALTVLAGISILFVAEIMTEFGSPLFYNVVNWTYGSITILLALRWFFIKRKNYGKST